MSRIRITRIVTTIWFCAILSDTSAQDWHWDTGNRLLNPSQVTPGWNSSPYLYDMDSDGDQDLILGKGDGTIELYLNEGFPDTNRWQLVPDFFEGIDFEYPVVPSMDDINGDNIEELVISVYDWSFMAIDSMRAFSNEGDFQNPVWIEIADFFRDRLELEEGEFLTLHNFRDWDDDGDLDLLAKLYMYDHPFAFYENIGSRENPRWVYDDTMTTYFSWDLAMCGLERFDVADFNSDGNFDLLLSASICDDGSAILLYINDGTNQIPELIPFEGSWIYQQGYYAYTPSVSDIDGDRDYDFIFGGEQPNLIIFINEGDSLGPNFENGLTYSLGPFALEASADFVFLDKDGDADLDIIFKYAYIIGIWPDFYTMAACNAKQNIGNQFTPLFVGTEWVPWMYIYNTEINFAAGDLNGDGLTDGIRAMYGNMDVYYGTPDSAFDIGGGFSSINSYYLKHPDLVDIDGDNDLDLYVIDNDADSLMAFRNTGTPQSPSWETASELKYGLPLSCASFRICDINLDYLPDMVVNMGNQLRAYMNRGWLGQPSFIFDDAVLSDISDLTVTYFDVANLDGDTDEDIIINIGDVFTFIENQSVLDITDERPSMPESQVLLSNYPNPFNAATTVEYSMADAGEVDLSIYDLMGKQIANLAQGHQNSGYHKIVWDGKDTANCQLSSGIYFMVLKTSDQKISRPILLLK